MILLYEILNILHQFLPRGPSRCHNSFWTAFNNCFSASIPSFIPKIYQVISNTSNKLNVMLNDNNCLPMIHKAVNDFNKSINILLIQA